MHPTIPTAPLVQRLEERVLQTLRSLIEEVPRWNLKATAAIFINAIGSNTDFQGWSIGIACTFKDVRADQPDEIALMVSLCHLDREPRVNAEVVWNTGIVEAEYSKSESSQDWPLATEQKLDQVVEILPKLANALENAVKRGSTQSAA